MDSLFDAHTGVILPVFATAYGLLLHKDRFGARGQTRLKHQEKGRKTPGKFEQLDWRCTPLLESHRTFGRGTFGNSIYRFIMLPILTKDLISQGNNLN